MANNYTEPSLNTLPSVYNRTIAEFLAPHIIAKCNFSAYLTLQRCCNPSFARDIRTVLKRPLQQVQAALASQGTSYVLQHPAVCQNPVFIASLKIEDLCLICNEAATAQITSVGSLVVAYGDSRRRYFSPMKWYGVLDAQRVIRTKTLLEASDIGGRTYGLCGRVEYWNDRKVEKYDNPLYDEIGGSLLVTLVRRTGECTSIRDAV